MGPARSSASSCPLREAGLTACAFDDVDLAADALRRDVEVGVLAYRLDQGLLRMADTRTAPTVELEVVAHAVGHHDGRVVLAADQVHAGEEDRHFRACRRLARRAGLGGKDDDAQLGAGRVIGLAPSARA